MIEITYPTEGGAEILVTSSQLATPTFRLRDRHTRKYLGSQGWSRVSVFLPCDTTRVGDSIRLLLQPPIAAQLVDGMQLCLEEPALDFRENFDWRAPKSVITDTPALADEPARAPEAPPVAAEAPSPVVVIADDTGPRPSPPPALPASANRTWLTLVPVILSAALLIASGTLYLKLRTVMGERDGLVAETASLKEAISGASDVTAALKKDLDNARSKATADLWAQNSDFQTRLNTLTEELARVSRERNNLVTSKTQLSQVGTNGATELAKVQQEVSDLTKENDRLRVKSQMLETTNADLAKRVNALISKPGNQSIDELERLRIENRNLNIQLSEQSSKMLTFDSQLTAMQGKLALAEQQRNSYSRSRWLAAAVDRKGSVQAITNQTSQDAAEKVAIKLCEGAGGGCRLIGSYESACFSLGRRDGAGVTRDNWGFGVAGTWQAAEDEALRDCTNVTGSNCSIRYTVCSPDTLDKPQ